MTAKVCDRCGEKYKLTEHANGEVVLEVNNSNHPSWPGGKRFDYCCDCTKIIEKFLRSKTNAT